MSSGTNFVSPCPWDFLHHKDVHNLLSRDEVARNRKAQASFNICSFVSSQSHYENLHSDIIHALLDVSGEHLELRVFLNLFIRWLKDHFVPELRLEDFENAQLAKREQMRMDIFIFDVHSKKAVIIENKINDAVDQDQQIDTYWKRAKASGFDVVAVVYLSLDGSKKAPPTEAGIDNIVFEASAFTDQPNDLVNGWLKPCQEQADQFQSKAFICQYIALLQSLSTMSFDLSTQAAFYNYLSDFPDHLKDLKVLIRLKEELPDYRARCFGDTISNNLPFKQFLLYKPNRHHWLFQNWTDDRNVWKMDIIFNHDSVVVGFWEPADQTSYSQSVRDKLTSVGVLERFDQGATFGSGVKRTFDAKYGCLRDMDQAATHFVHELLQVFRGQKGN
jgi:PD-(D/E)XK nuclease superfamily